MHGNVGGLEVGASLSVMSSSSSSQPMIHPLSLVLDDPFPPLHAAFPLPKANLMGVFKGRPGKR